MGVIPEDHYNLDTNLIASLLLSYVRNNPQFKLKEVQTTVKVAVSHTPSYKNAWLGRRRAFKIIYGDFDESFAQRPMYMNALKHFNPGTVVEWVHADRSTAEINIFKYIFGAFKLCIKGFKSCKPVISIDGTHIYGKYDLKMLIIMTADANGQIFSLAFAIIDKESKDAWSWFLSCLAVHVVKGRREVTYIQIGLLELFEVLRSSSSCMSRMHIIDYVRHLKSNFNSKFSNKGLEGMMWYAAIQHQERKFKSAMCKHGKSDRVKFVSNSKDT
ncbi:uncharacterized protein LOC107824194 [Nicotiana tabacum]|uniref:Uncharacterized protein LOC107824194 n=1 Tax=Nicotiana tabacum TaxID=4097 RepID=A0A1S4CZ50_TOBAC|nr:PREDICTED: uncharacterized protein LOC107824194 [Nicotiana tabacum]